MIVPKHYEDLAVLHENTMPNRAYYVPASGRMSGLPERRRESDRFQLLSGSWRFRYYSSIYDAVDPFYETGYDHASFDTVQVPGMWQMYGYDRHQYTNIRYPFPVDPPYVPQENPCGAYVLEFDYRIDAAAPMAYLNFEGVDSCFYVWINGKYVGYSQVPHSTSEFDVTPFLIEGSNKLAVLVLKWCDGSYLEDQDKFRMSGIFRDVYLLKRPEKHIRDYSVVTTLSRLAINLDSPVPVAASLYDGETLLASASGENSLVLAPENVIPWNAEQPKLYTLYLETPSEVITEQVGFREICIRDSVVYLNGKRIHFRGVNRHDSDPVTGFAISMDQVKKDMLLMKQHNVNAIRTSHYPNSPWFYQLCDRYGFYVIDEADNESHGTSEQVFDPSSGETYADIWNKKISDNSQWSEAVLDRVQRLVIRDRNRPSVVIWSMGNECGFGRCFEGALEWTKKTDPTRLTHYEGAHCVSKGRKYDYSNLDLYSRMYPSVQEIETYLNNSPDKPYILCEYSHAMGNGPGDFEAYYRLFREHDIMCGGFVWEWCDHAIYKGTADNGKPIYFYGGDHNEWPNDGNFCMDGLVYPDRRPHTGLAELKNVQRPARVIGFDQKTGCVTLENQLDFVDLKDYIAIVWELTCDGQLITSGSVETPSVKPHSAADIMIHLPKVEKGRVYLKFMYFRKEPSALLPAGFDLGFDEIALKTEDNRNRITDVFSCGASQSVRVEESDRYISIIGESFQYTYNKLTGLWSDLVRNGAGLLQKPMELNIWRAPTDNDRNVKALWKRACYDIAASRAYKTDWTQEKGEVRICSTVAVVAMTVQRIMSGEIRWTVLPNGELRMDISLEKDGNFPMLPRFGLRMFLPEAMNKAEYYGMGPMESYVDKHRASWHGRFFADVTDLHEDYLRPQENGSHYDCDYVRIYGENASVTVVGENTFSFNASPFTQEELTDKPHNYELEPCGATVLCIDAAQNGIGSNSCGPELAPEFRLDAKRLDFSIRIVLE